MQAGEWRVSWRVENAGPEVWACRLGGQCHQLRPRVPAAPVGTVRAQLQDQCFMSLPAGVGCGGDGGARQPLRAGGAGAHACMGRLCCASGKCCIWTMHSVVPHVQGRLFGAQTADACSCTPPPLPPTHRLSTRQKSCACSPTSTPPPASSASWCGRQRRPQQQQEQPRRAARLSIPAQQQRQAARRTPWTLEMIGRGSAVTSFPSGQARIACMAAQLGNVGFPNVYYEGRM